MKPVLPQLLVASVLVGLAGPASAVDYTFNGGVADWNTAGAWTPVGPPGGGSGNHAIVNSGTANITADTALIQDPFIGRGAGTNGTVNQTAGNHSNVGWTFIGTEGGTGAWNVTGTGSMTTGRIYVGGRRENDGGNGSMLIDTTGSITATSDFAVATRGAQGNVVMNKGTLTANTWMIIGESDAGVGGTTGTFTQNGGAVNVGATDAGGRLWLGSNEGGAAVTGTKGQYFLNGGTLDSNNIWVGKDYEGVFTQAAGTTFTIRGTGDDSRIGANAGSTGTYTMNGGTLNVNGNFQIGGSGTGTFNQSGGAASFNSWPVIGRFGGGNGQANVSGGTFTQNDGATRLIVGEDGTGTLTVSGAGSVTSNGGLSVGHAGSGSGTVNINAGGTISAPFIGRGNGTALINFNGGTVRATATQAEYFALLDVNFLPTTNPMSATNVEFQAGGAIIDTNGFNIGTAVAFDGVGGLTKSGAGMLTMSGVMTYTGNTVVQAGTLALNGTSLSSTTVKSGASLQGTGLVTNNVVIEAGGTLSPGNSVGVLSIVGSLTIAGNLAAETDNTNLADLVDVTGSVTLLGTSAISLSHLGATPAAGDTFLLIRNDGVDAINGQFSNLADGAFVTIGGMTGLVDYQFDSLTGTLNLGNDLAIRIQPVPEPAAAALIGLGLFAIRRRRR